MSEENNEKLEQSNDTGQKAESPKFSPLEGAKKLLENIRSAVSKKVSKVVSDSSADYAEASKSALERGGESVEQLKDREEPFLNDLGKQWNNIANFLSEHGTSFKQFFLKTARKNTEIMEEFSPMKSLNSAELKLFKSLLGKTPDDADLQYLIDIGLVSMDTRKKIVSTLPDHEGIFERTRESLKPIKNAPSSPTVEALYRTYGKYLLEQRNSNNKSTEDFCKILSDHLKTKLDPEKLKDRPELKITKAYLDMVELSNFSRAIDILNELDRDLSEMKMWTDAVVNLADIDRKAPDKHKDRILAAVKKLRQLNARTKNEKLDLAINLLEVTLKEPAEQNFSSLSILRETFANKGKKLSDAKVSKEVLTTIVKKQFPDLDIKSARQMASLVLTEGLFKLHSMESYEDLAKKGSEDMQAILENSEVKNQILSVTYKVNGKVERPFAKLGMNDLKDFDNLEGKFDAGLIDLDTGMQLLAVLKEQKSAKYTDFFTRLSEKLKRMIAAELKMEDEMTRGPVMKLVNKAFEELLAEQSVFYKGYFAHIESNIFDFKKYKLNQLQQQFRAIKEKRNLGEMSYAKYEEEYSKLFFEAERAGVKEEFAFYEDVVLSSAWNSEEMQWVRDRAVDVARFGKDKALAVGAGALDAAGRSIFGGLKLGLSLGWHTALTPFRALKYPLLVGAKPLAFVANFFKREKWTPKSISETIKEDVDRVLNYSAEKAENIRSGAAKALEESFVPRWREAKFHTVAYKDRTKIDLEALENEAGEFAEKSESAYFSVDSRPRTNLEKYKRRLKKIKPKAA